MSLREAFARLPERTPAVGERRATVALLTGCVQDVFFHRVNEATVRVLAAEGCDVLAPRDQQCCGALELHAGREDDALGRARRTIARFEALGRRTHVVTNVAGCGSSMKDYGHLLADDPEWAERAAAFSAKVRDVHEVLDELLATARAPRGTRSARGSPTTTPATSGTPRACAPSPARCCARSRSWRSSTSPRPRCAAARRGSTTW